MKFSSLHAWPLLLGGALLSSCATTPQVDPGAQTVLNQTTEKLRTASTIEAWGAREEDPALLPPGSTRERIKFDITAVHPGSLSVKSDDGVYKRDLIAGNGKISLYDEKTNCYSSVPTESTTIDDLVDDIQDEFDIKMVISDLLGEDPLADIMDGVTSVKVVGDEMVGKEACTRLSFTQKDLSWDLWVAKSDVLPRKAVLTYTQKPGQPTKTMIVNKWRLNGPVPTSTFVFKPGENAQQVDVIH